MREREEGLQPTSSDLGQQIPSGKPQKKAVKRLTKWLAAPVKMKYLLGIKTPQESWEGPHFKRFSKVFSQTAIDYKPIELDCKLLQGRLQILRLPNAEFFQMRNEPKTRYSGHTFSRLARVWT